jgi:diketogulonate reductase-like aldo/keto reductase
MMQMKELGKSGTRIPVLGMGTWGIGGFSSPSDKHSDSETTALRHGLKLGLSLIDTAEIYAAGHSEEAVAEAIAHERDRVFLATKVSGQHLKYDEVLRAAERSLNRLRTSSIDLYQIHWPNSRIPIAETMRAMEKLVGDGKVKFIGVSNFSVDEIKEAQAALSRYSIQANQVEFSLLDRSIENELLPHCQNERITLIAYSPLARGEIGRLGSSATKRLLKFRERLGRTPVQLALRWLIDQDQVVAIPKAARVEHLDEIVGAVGWSLAKEDHAAISREFS